MQFVVCYFYWRYDLIYHFFLVVIQTIVLSLSLHNEILYKAQVKQKVNIGQIQRSTDDCLYIFPTKVLNYGFLKNPQIPK